MLKSRKKSVEFQMGWFPMRYPGLLERVEEVQLLAASDNKKKVSNEYLSYLDPDRKEMFNKSSSQIVSECEELLNTLDFLYLRI